MTTLHQEPAPELARLHETARVTLRLHGPWRGCCLVCRCVWPCELACLAAWTLGVV